ncbi:MAG: bifunctional UDP-N-acetylmuramoyl-tripeptide:D-alanyl-D-alanine ligase/alanine racemase [Lentimicrobiaceae bacterium]|nr:bifunctional UDP-N-acetylmuramoyl-tripeptide:D-alanyl-D-alanine ligase/alanine racemase [Lentimicrobiaceae bacterium]
MSYTINKICSIVKGTSFGKSNNNIIINDLIFDSRLIVAPDYSIFFALKSNHNDGHKYINELYNKGVRAFVIDDEEALQELIVSCKDASFIKVNNSLEALQQLASYHRNIFNIPIIGITGSNGKTIVKEWLYHILSPEFSVIRSPKSYNSQIGVALSAWQINDNHDIAILEAGISRSDEMQKLENIIKPNIGIFTNIGQAHGKNFSDVNHKIEEKLKLFHNVETLIFCIDHKEIYNAVKKLNINTFTWSKTDNSADIFIKNITKNEKETCIKTIYNSEDIEIIIPFKDDASIENAIHCMLTALKLGIDISVIINKMKTLSPLEMRMELKSGINNCVIIDDSYNSDFNALTIALNFMNQQDHNKDKVVILSDILQSEFKEDELYQKIANLLKNKGINFIIGIGEAISRQKDKFDIDKAFFKNTEEFISRYPIESFHNQLILIKGARTFGFEKISKVLQEKAHETILEINLNNLIKNYNYYRSKLKKETKMMVMVKAFAYGSGNFEISNALEFHHADYLTVAYADEGIELRKKGINLPIMVMAPELNTFESIIKNNLEPVIYSFRSLSLLEDAIDKIEKTPSSPIGIHLKLDSGMHRLGFLSDDIEPLIERIKDNDSIRIRSIFSHLAGSDSSEFDDYTIRQIECFEDMSNRIISAFPYKILRHILNSAGISRFTEYQYDMVRLGIGLYGISACKEDKVSTVISLKSTIVQIKEYEIGETVGYSRKAVLSRKSRIGVIPIGYADGLKRQLGNGVGCFYVNGKAAPIIGNICMDMCMIDLTDIECKEEDTAVLFDESHPIEDIAMKCDTIPYEILTSISQRVKRVYYQE